MAKTQITTGRVRFSYVNAFHPRADQNGVEKYSVMLLIPKSDTATLAKMKAAAQAAKDNWVEKGKKLPSQLKTTLHDGDGVTPNGGEPYGPECAGHYVMNVSSTRKPVIVYADKTPITEESELYSGCYGRAIINFYVYDNQGNRGVSAGLMGLQKLSDGEPLGGGVVRDEDWDDDFDDSAAADDLLG